MKYLFFFIFLSPLTILAQFNKGDMFIGGSVRLDAQKAGDNKSSLFGLQPQAGFFLNSHLALGGALGYTHNHQENLFSGSTTTDNNNTYSAGFLVRNYYQLADKFFFALQGNFGYYHSVFKSSSASFKNKSDYFNVGVSPMFIFFPSQRWGLEASLGYLNFFHAKGATSFNVNYGSVSLGVSYYLRKGN